MKTKIYLFNNTPKDSWNYKNGNLVCFAIAETGEVLASHMCSSTYFMKGDLIENRPERKEQWNKKFPDGYEIIELKDGETPPTDVMDKNEQLGLKEKQLENEAG